MIPTKFITAFLLASGAIWLVAGLLARDFEMAKVGALQLIASGVWYQKGQP